MKRGTGWALMSLAAVAVTLAGWLAWRGGHLAAVSDVGPASGAPMSASSRAAARAPTPVASAPPKAVPVRAEAAADVPPGHVAVCHGLPVPRKRTSAERDRELQQEVFPALRQALAGLAVHPEPRMRAAGALLATHQLHAEHLARALGADCQGASCPKDLPSEDRAAVNAAVRPQLDGLVRQALDSGDSTVYGLALQACKAPFLGREAGGACAQLSAAEWARREPDNRQAWWRVATEAQNRGDVQARDDALARAAAASRDDNYLAVVVEAAFAAVPDTAHGRLQAPMMMAVVDAWTTSLLATPPVSALCRAEHLGNANVRQQCERLAEVLTRQPKTLLDLSMGVGTGRKLGWPAERLPNTTERHMQQAEASELLIAPEDDPTSCRTVDHQRRWLADLGRLGEVGAAELLVARSGVDPDALRRRGEARVAALVRDAQAAASAAKANSAPTQ